MGLIRKPQTANSSADEPLAAQDPVVHSEHFCQEAVDELEREARFRRTLSAALDDTVDEQRRVLKRRAAKAEFYLTQMMAKGGTVDWDELIERAGARDPRTADFLRGLVAKARANELLP